MKLEIKRRFQLGHEGPELQPHQNPNLLCPAEAKDKANEMQKVIIFIIKKVHGHDMKSLRKVCFILTLYNFIYYFIVKLISF